MDLHTRAGEVFEKIPDEPENISSSMCSTVIIPALYDMEAANYAVDVSQRKQSLITKKGWGARTEAGGVGVVSKALSRSSLANGSGDNDSSQALVGGIKITAMSVGDDDIGMISMYCI